MPSRTVELAVIDTSVYIENFRSGRFTQRIADSPFLFRGISVVIHELLRGAKQTEEREFALDLAANLRLYTPTEQMWLDSGDIVARIAAAKGYEKRKIQELSSDVLIALTARSVGATVITKHGRLRRHPPISTLSPGLLGITPHSAVTRAHHKSFPFSLEARLEAGDPSVSLDLLIRSLISLGATERELSQIITTPRAA